MSSHERIRGDMTATQAIVAMSDGNPGAVRVCADVLRSNADGVPGFFRLLRLDNFAIHGPRIWMLYKDVCREDLGTMLAVLDAAGTGKITRAALDHAIDNRGAGLDLTPYMPASPPVVTT